MSDQPKYVNTDIQGHIATIALNNPPRHTINAAGSEQLLVELERLDSNSNIRVVVVTGASSDIFIRHYEVAELAASSQRLVSRWTGHERPARPGSGSRSANSPRGLRGAMLKLESMDAITIAAINGMAMGGGLELALACDFRLAREGEFSIGLPETGVGILPGGGGTQRLARMLGAAKALDLILHGSLMKPGEALAQGIVSRVFPNDAERYADEVRRFASNLASRAPRALANAKRAIREGLEMNLIEGLRREAELFAELMATEDAANALSAAQNGSNRVKFRGR